MLDKSDESLTRVYNALANPIRRQIVQILKQRGKAGFKELHDTLKISVGALYHHLDSLEGLVAQEANRKYVLTEEGRAAINVLSTGEERIIANAAQARIGESRLGFVSRELLFGRTALNYLSQEPLRSLPIAAIILALGGAISFMTNLEPILLFYLNPTHGITKSWFLLLFPLGWFITFGVADIMCYLFYHRRGGELSLVNGTAFAMMPLLLVPGLILLVQPFSAIIQSATAFTILLQIGVQVWVVCLLSSAVSISKGLKIERTALISLAVMYLNITAVIFALSLGLF
jgi:DNA-binding transcriptional ArsR family regulator